MNIELEDAIWVVCALASDGVPYLPAIACVDEATAKQMAHRINGGYFHVPILRLGWDPTDATLQSSEATDHLAPLAPDSVGSSDGRPNQ